MACSKCKRDFDKMKPYSVEADDDFDDVNDGIASRIAHFVAQLFFGFLVSVILIIMTVPMLLYISFCMMLGKQPYFKIPNFNNKVVIKETTDE